MDHAISTLQISLDNARTNERVMREEGRIEEADACRARAESYIEAIAALECIRSGHFKEPSTFEGKIAWAINCHSRENGSNTPDFILAEYLKRCLDNFDLTVRAREEWSLPGDLPETVVIGSDIIPEILAKAEGAGCSNDGEIIGYLTGEISRLRSILNRGGVPLSEGIPQPPEGFAYAGKGPIENPQGMDNSDILGFFFPSKGWYHASWSGEDPCHHYAVRIGSEIAKANGITS